MNEEDQKSQNASALADQKSDKTPEELMNQVANSDGSLEPAAKVSSVDAMADESNADINAANRIKRQRQKGIKGFLGRINIYLLLFLLIMVIAGVSTGILYFYNKREQNLRLETTEITEETLEALKTSDAIVGDPKQILTVESNMLVTGKVVMRDTLDVAGALKIGGPLSLPSIRAAGEGNFGSITTNDIQAAGNVAIGGILDVAGGVTIGESISAGGAANFGGRLDVGGAATINGSLNVNGTISATGINFGAISINHINVTGGTPGVSVGGAAGGGGTASISGSDTAGTATINTGGGTGTGVLATIFFNSAFSTSNPHPVLTPNGPSCASIAFYVTNISASQFAIATASAPPPGVACRFNYIVIN